MSHTKRKLREQDRPHAGYRDTSRIIIGCEDRYAVKQYFDQLKLRRVKVITLTPDHEGISYDDVLAKLLQFEIEDGDQRWFLHDIDHLLQPNHTAGFQECIQRARREEIQVVLSRPCFDLWLLLHHVNSPEVAQDDRCEGISNQIRTTLGEYNKTNLKPEHFPDSRKIDAYERAKLLDTTTNSGLIPTFPTTRVYKLLEAIIRKATHYELSPELQLLKRRIEGSIPSA